jgi:enterochelin esterase-like enzyme
MLARLLLLLPIMLSSVSGQTPTYSVAGPNDSPSIVTLRHKLDSGSAAAVKNFWDAVHKSGAPLIEATPGVTGFSLVTFLWHGDNQTRNVVIFDGVAGFDAKDQMFHLDGSDVWYKTYRVRNDARFAYNLSPNDSLQSINDVKGDDAMRKRLAMLKVDPLNPHHCPTTFGAYGSESSYVELPGAPPLIWSQPVAENRRGRVTVISIPSAYLKKDKKLWVYTPVGFRIPTDSRKESDRYPLLVVFDGDRNVEWIPKILDVLIAKGRIPPVVAVMTDESVPADRRVELPCNPQFADFLAKELIPWARRNYDATTQPELTIVAGSSFGGLASVFAGLKYPEVFGSVISQSGSFFWKPDGAQQGEWLTHQLQEAPKLPVRFYVEVGLMESDSMEVGPNRRMRDALSAKGELVGYSEFDGGHSFLNWSGGMVNGLEYLTRPSKSKVDSSSD